MTYREWLRTATEDDIAETLCEIQSRGGCGGCVGVNYTGSDGTCSGKPGEAVRKWLQAEKEPSAQPEYKLDEWCDDCKEYDQERHCCPRWNRVIRQTLEELEKAQPEIVRCRDCRWSPWRSRMYADSAVEIKVCSHSRSPEGFCAWGKEAEKCGD